MIDVFGVKLNIRCGHLIMNFVESSHAFDRSGYSKRDKPMTEKAFFLVSYEEFKQYRNVGEKAIEEIVKAFRDQGKPLLRIEEGLAREKRIRERRLSRLNKKKWAKIVHEEGVVFEKKFRTQEEAEAFVEGFRQYEQILKEEELDLLDDCYSATTDNQPATIEN